MSISPEKHELQRDAALAADATGASGVPTDANETLNDVAEARRRVMKRLAAGAFAAPVVLVALQTKAFADS